MANERDRGRRSALVLATRNPHKVREISALLSDTGIDVLSFHDLPDLPDVEEDGETLEENAIKKAEAVVRATDLPALADDTGLEVDALGGAPGVHSARYAGSPRDDTANNRRLVRELAGVPLERRTARFRCAMAFVRDGVVVLETEGSVAGVILDQPRGASGFGYDPHFLIPDLGRTAAELPPDQKNALSHRGQALRAMLARIEALFRSLGEWNA